MNSKTLVAKMFCQKVTIMLSTTNISHYMVLHLLYSGLEKYSNILYLMEILQAKRLKEFLRTTFTTVLHTCIGNQ